MDALLERFRTAEITVGVIGLGYVGLPLAVLAAERGLRTIGFDVSEGRVALLEAGTSHVEDVPDGALKHALLNGMVVTTDEVQLREADALLIAVPSPLNRSRQPEMKYIGAAAQTISRVARSGQVISLESTTYPGTTEEYLLPAVREAGLVLDEDIFVAFSPERVDPGNRMTTREIPKVVGGVTTRSGEVAAALYERIVDRVHLVSHARAAELTKLLENTYRAVNIALVNELAQVAHAFGIDIWEVIDAAATKPFGYQPFRPGPGVGGHCIPLDPQFLAFSAREIRAATRFIDLAEDVNRHMPDWVVSRVTDELNSSGLPVFGTAVLGVGIAYKANISDDRESPARDVLGHLMRRGAHVGALDPHVDEQRIRDHGYEAVAQDDDLTSWKLAIILTDHADIDYARIAEQVELVFDTRGVYRRLGIAADNVRVL